jgi:hypothetical protein
MQRGRGSSPSASPPPPPPPPHPPHPRHPLWLYQPSLVLSKHNSILLIHICWNSIPFIQFRPSNSKFEESKRTRPEKKRLEFGKGAALFVLFALNLSNSPPPSPPSPPSDDSDSDSDDIDFNECKGTSRCEGRQEERQACRKAGRKERADWTDRRS